MTTEPTHLDDFIKFGRYTVLTCVAVEILMIVQCGSFLFMIFGGAAPKVIGCRNSTVHNSTNLSETELCGLYHGGECEPILEYEFYSVNVEFNRICDDTKDVKDSMSCQMIGFAVGALVFGQASDLFGRKWTMFFCALAQAIVGFGMAFSTNLRMFSISNMFLTFFLTGHDVVACVLMSESFPKKHRFWMFFVFSWAPNIAFVTLLAYVAGSWRALANVFNVLALTGCGVLLFLSETPHFLLRKGRADEAARVIRRIYQINGHELSETALEKVLNGERKHLEEESEKSQNYYYHHLFSTWRLVGFTFAVSYSFFSVSLINFGVIFNMEKIPGSLYFNTALMGVIRYIVNIGVALADRKFAWMGRKTIHHLFSSYAILALTIAIGLQFFDLSPLFTLINQLLLISASSVIAQLYSIVALSTTEIFPTPVRNAAFAMTQFTESIACMLAPQMFHLSALSEHLPFLVMVVLQVWELISYHLLVPESKGHPLPDKMPPVEDRLCCFRRGNRMTNNAPKNLEMK